MSEDSHKEAYLEGYQDKTQEQQEEYAPRIESSIQFTNKIIEPDKDLINKICNVFPDADTEELLENIKLMYNTITRDYSLGNLDKPQKTNNFKFVDFCHAQKTVNLFSCRPHLALGMDSLMKGTLLLTRSIGMKQQELFVTSKQEKRFEDKVKKGGLIPSVRGG